MRMFFLGACSMLFLVSIIWTTYMVGANTFSDEGYWPFLSLMASFAGLILVGPLDD